MSKRLHILVEGQTEVAFVKRIIAPYLLQNFNIITDARAAPTSHKNGRIYRGGGSNYEHVRKDMLKWSNERQGDCFSTMFDFYGLPFNFPGMDNLPRNQTHLEQVEYLEHQLLQNFKGEIALEKFIPYIQLHEFEALLFAEISKLSEEYPESIFQLNKLIASTQGMAPEDINNGKGTAPSKRICNFFPRYKKTTVGINTVELIGLSKIRARCPHFDAWLQKLEKI